MNKYSHKKGIINNNALEALLHDPLFRQRVESNKKGKGSYKRINKHGKNNKWEGIDKNTI